MWGRRIALLGLVIAAFVFAARKKNPDDTTQTLDLPKDPPMVAAGEAGRLVFHVSPLSNKGLLSQQTREALKAILRMNGGGTVIHIRAFVAGSGDARRVPQIVSEVFGDKKMPLPSVSVVQAGALAMEGAQVVLETVTEAKRPVNADGLAFTGARNPSTVTSPLMATCYVSDIGEAPALVARFPGAPVDVVQTRRISAGEGARCEAVERGGNFRAAKLAFTGTQLAFGADEKAARVAFQRIDRELSGDVIIGHIYALSPAIGEMARRLRAATYPVTVVPVEGLASIDGSFAVDAVAVQP